MGRSDGFTGVAACRGGTAVPAVPGLDRWIGAVDRGGVRTGEPPSCGAGLGAATGVDALAGMGASFLLCRGARSGEGAIEGTPIPAVPWPSWEVGLADEAGDISEGRLSCGAGLEPAGVVEGSAGLGAPFLPCRGKGLGEAAAGEEGFPAVPGRLTVVASVAWPPGAGCAAEGGITFAVPGTEPTWALWRVDLISDVEICPRRVLSELGTPGALGRAVNRVAWGETSPVPLEGRSLVDCVSWTMSEEARPGVCASLWEKRASALRS